MLHVTLSIFKSSMKDFLFSKKFNLHTFLERVIPKSDSIFELFIPCTIMNNLEVDFSS